MTAAVAFNFGTWTTMFPEFAGVPQPMGQVYFDLAGLYCQNDACNPAFPTGTLGTLLYLLTSHIAWLNAPRDGNGNPSQTGQPASPLVGRIASAGEGSVNVSAEWKGSGSPSEDWFTQTKYGAMYWQATAQYRTGRYAAQPTIIGNPILRGSVGYGTPYPGYRRRW